MTKESPIPNVERRAALGIKHSSLIRHYGVGISHSTSPSRPRPIARARSGETGSVLIIVMWIAFGLVSIAIYFAHAMSLELRASDNRVASLEAEQAIEGAARYVNYVLTTYATNGVVPDPTAYQREAVLVGPGRFWLIGRSDQQTVPTEPTFSLIDEAGKLNLNTATLAMLQALPNMPAGLAAAIIDWRDADSNITQGGAESETYSTLQPAYSCKNAPFDTVDELRLVYGATLDILYGEDSNFNGVLDLNEDDGSVSLPEDNHDGHLDPGIFEYVTVYSSQPNAARTNVNTRSQIEPLLQQVLGTARANQVLLSAGIISPQAIPTKPGQPPAAVIPVVPIRSVLEFYIKSGMTADQFGQIATQITAITTNKPIQGLINVNTARAEVLGCISNIGPDKATSLVAYRQANPDKLTSIAWVKDALNLDIPTARQIGPYLTTESYQFTADIAAVGHHTRGYSRARFIFDTSEGTPKIRYRQDLTRLGWALGNTTRQRLLLAKDTLTR